MDGFVDARAHIPDSIARLPPWFRLLHVSYCFYGCLFEETTNEDTLLAINKVKATTRKKSANEVDGFVDARALISDAIARMPPWFRWLHASICFYGCLFEKTTNEDTLLAINKVKAPTRKKSANEVDGFVDARPGHIFFDAIARLPPWFRLLHVRYCFYGCLFEKKE